MFRGVLRSKLAWTLSGLSYPTAIVATRGHYESRRRYLIESRTQMAVLLPVMPANSRVLEFGAGLGGNLISISNEIRCGTGLDVNRGYLRIATRLARHSDVGNLTFASYDGTALPDFEGEFDFIFSLGVFERLSQSLVTTYLSSMATILCQSGRMAHYFLSDRARNSRFTKRLGDDAYTFWNPSMIAKTVADSPIRLLEKGPLSIGYGDVYVFERS
jgi:hypothetical protein